MVLGNSPVNLRYTLISRNTPKDWPFLFWFQNHLYTNHMEQVDLQLSRTPGALPQLVIRRKADSLFDYKFDDFDVTGYEPQAAIKAPVAV